MGFNLAEDNRFLATRQLLLVQTPEKPANFVSPGEASKSQLVSRLISQHYGAAPGTSRYGHSGVLDLRSQGLEVGLSL